MVVSLLLALPLLQSGPVIERDSYGVPKVSAASWEEGFRGFGRAVAQDRLWQMELSRRLARGRMAELGDQYRRSDEATLRQAYTEEEVESQLKALPSRVRQAFVSYAEGVNEEIEARVAAGTLPSGYQGRRPEPWTPLDSAYVAINLIRRFGTGGAGELRTLALYEYLKTQKVKGKELDVLDDIAWHNDPLSPVTLKKEDEGPGPNILPFDRPTRKNTLTQLSQMPKVGLLELAGAATMASLEPQRLVAEKVGVASKWGSYAVAVSAQRSRTGRAFLLGAPQMGHSTPSVIHEAALRFPGMMATGVSVPGVPVIAIGMTPDHAWTLTTGAADVEDIFVSKLDAEGRAAYGSEWRPLKRITFERKDAKGEVFTVVQERTHHGPVILKSVGAKAVFSRQSALWGKELTGIEALFRMAEAEGTAEVFRAAEDAFPCFNFFFASRTGDIGWRFTGRMPIRARGLDPRFPTPSSPENEWKGFLSPEQMPQVKNPRKGLLVNWNNKPVSWWTNGDTPTWGRFFRSRLLEDALPSGKIGRSDLELAAWTIARKDPGSPIEFRQILLEGEPAPGLREELEGADGWALDGSLPALAMREGVLVLRQEIFGPWLGNLTNPSLFEQALQPEVVWRAALRKTKFNYTQGRPDWKVAATRILLDRLTDPARRRAGYQPGRIIVPGEPPIPYIARGTTIQITELSSPPVGRSVASPGVSETGPHSLSQAPLARAWLYKAMWGY